MLTFGKYGNEVYRTMLQKREEFMMLLAELQELKETGIAKVIDLFFADLPDPMQNEAKLWLDPADDLAKIQTIEA